MPVIVISIDGPDFCGKTTVANIVVEALREKYKNLDLQRTELPSHFISGAYTQILRSVVEKVPAEVFALAYAADHLFHYINSIKPLEQDKENHVVIQERSLLTTYIYQGILGKVDTKWLDEINKFNRNIPKLTIVLKLPIEVIKQRKSLDRRYFDKFESDDHVKKQAETFYNLPDELVKKFNVMYVDANTDVNTVAKRCLELIEKEIDKF